MICPIARIKKKSKAPALPNSELPKFGSLRLKETDETNWGPIVSGPFLVPVTRWIE